MAMKKPQRKPEEIAAEYGRVAAELGDAYYRLHVGIPAAIETLLERARALNLEASEAQKPTPNTENPSDG